MVKKEYENLRKKYDLPNFEILDNEFEISTIEKPEFLLRSIKKKMCEKIETASDILAKMIQPETTSIANLYEYRCFDDAAKRKIFDLFSKAMYLYRKLLETDLLVDEKSDADIIKQIASEWPELRKQVLPFVKELEACWKKTPEGDHELKEYLG